MNPQTWGYRGDAIKICRRLHHHWGPDDRDLNSKQTLWAMFFLFTLTGSGGQENAPVLTIPTQ